MSKNNGTKLKPLTSSKLSEDASNLERIIAELPDGKAIILSYVRQIALTEDVYKDFIRDYDTDKKIDIGDLCNRHSIPHADFIARIVKEAYPITDELMNLSKIMSTKIVAARLPNVVKRGMIEGAKTFGVADRHFTLQNEGFHVAPKGTNINLTQVNQQAAGLPSFEDETRSLSNILADADAEILELTEGETEYVETEVEKELQEA